MLFFVCAYLDDSDPKIENFPENATIHVLTVNLRSTGPEGAVNVFYSQKYLNGVASTAGWPLQVR
jgi:hypothetical protein